MNRKGFTLIELLAVIILIGLVATLIIPTAIKSLNESKQKSYEIFIDDVKTAAANYYMECENGNTTITCDINGGKITTTLGNLASYGFLSSYATDQTSSVLNIYNPMYTNKKINNCSIIVIKNENTYIDVNGITSSKVTYELQGSTTQYCPTTDEFKGVFSWN